ncbi:MAG: GNAT family N-acetyltransferase [Acidimicrobiales bacterium]|nr:GNAT family N-acetyltransferase [Acidimicrobiales bacterium]
MVRVLLVINRLTDHGGAEVSTVGMLDQLQGSGFTFHVVTLFEETDTALRPELEYRGARFSMITGHRAQRLRQLVGIVDDFQPDIVHGTLFDGELLAVAAARRRGVPSLVSLVNMQYDDAARAVAPSPRRLELVRRFESKVVGAATHVHALTRAVARHGSAQLGVPPARITVVPRGRAAARLGRRSEERGAEARRGLGIGPTTPVLLHVARHEPQKGHDLLLNALAKVVAEYPDAQLLLAGRDGTATRSITAAISKNRLSSNIRILGARTDVAELHNAADVFCFPSRYEGLGGSVVEAMALETPIVSFGIDVIREVTGGHAHLVEPFDTDAFAAAVLAVLDDAPDPHIEAARRRFESTFTEEVSAAGMAKLYRSHARPNPLDSTTGPSGRHRSWSLARAVADDGLRDELNRQAMESGVYFRSHDWLAAWWEHAADQPVGTAHGWYDGDRLTGFAALARGQAHLHRIARLPMTTWRLAGTGVGAADHTGWACDPAIVPEVADWMRSIAGSDTLLLPNLAAEHAGLIPPRAQLLEETRCPAIDLTGDAGPSKSFRKKLRAYRRKVEAAGISLETIPPGSVTEAHLRTLFALHATRSNMADRSTSFDDSLLAFHAQLAAAATDQFGPGLVVARRDADIVGMLYGFWAGSTFAYYQSGWQPDLADLNLGTVLVAQAIGDARAAGATRFDLLRGAEPYKYRFGAVDQIDTTWIAPSAISGRLWLAGRALHRRVPTRTERAAPAE